MSTTLSDLVVKLDMDSAKFRGELEKTNASLGGLGKKVDALGGMFAAKFSFDVIKEAGTALWNFAKRGIDTADAMGKLASSVGMSVEDLSRLNHAADLSGVSTEDLGSSLGKLSRTMMDAATGSKEQAAWFSTLGIATTSADGKLRGVSDVLGELADRFAKMEDGTAKTAIAQELFGRSGAKLIPLLNEGSEGLAELTAEADRLGLTITSGAAASSAEFNDNLSRLQSVANGVGISVATELSPSLSNLTAELLDSKDGANAFSNAGKIMAGVFRVIASGAAIVAGLFQVIGQNIAMTAAAAVYAGQGEFQKAWDVIKAGHGDMLKSVLDVKDRVAAIWSEEKTPEAKALEAQHKSEQERADKLLSKLEKVKAAQIAAAAAAKQASAERERELAAQQRLAEKFADIDADSVRGLTGMGRDASAKRQEFANAGKTDQEKLSARTSGFRDFEHAMSVWAEQTSEHTGQMAYAAKLKAEGDTEGANAALEAAEYMKALADAAADAADGFIDQKELGIELRKMELARAAEARGGMGDKLAGSFGMASELGQAGAQGAMAAGPIGALAGVVLALVTKAEAFMGIVEMIGLVGQTLADGLGSFLKPVIVLVAALMPLADAFGAMIEPFGMVVEAVLGQFAPVLVVLGALFQSFAPVMKVVATALALLVNIVMLNFTPVLVLLFESLRLAAYGMTSLMVAFAPVWNGFLTAIQEFLRNIANFEIKIGDYAIKPFAALGDWANNLESGKMSVDELAAQLQELEGLTWDEARAKAENIAAQNDQTEAVREATGALTNMPNAFRYAMRKFDSMTTATSALVHRGGSAIPKFAESGTVYGPGLAVVGDGHEPEHIMGDGKFRQAIREELSALAGMLRLQLFIDGREVYAAVQHHATRDVFQRTGSLVAGAPRYAGG